MNLVSNENTDLLEDSHNVLNRWEKYLSQSPNEHRSSDVRRIEIHTAEPLTRFEFEIAIARLQKYTSPGSDQLPAELIQAVSEMLRSQLNKLINFNWNKKELSDQWKETIFAAIYIKGNKTDFSNYSRTSLLTSYKF
jgi:hypothetical protein